MRKTSCKISKSSCRPSSNIAQAEAWRRSWFSAKLQVLGAPFFVPQLACVELAPTVIVIAPPLSTSRPRVAESSSARAQQNGLAFALAGAFERLGALDRTGLCKWSLRSPLVSPHHATEYARLQIVLGLVTIGPWIALIVWDLLYYCWRFATFDFPIFGGRARGRERPRAPSLAERSDGARRSFSLRGSGSPSKSAFDSHDQKLDSDQQTASLRHRSGAATAS